MGGPSQSPNSQPAAGKAYITDEHREKRTPGRAKLIAKRAGRIVQAIKARATPMTRREDRAAARRRQRAGHDRAAPDHADHADQEPTLNQELLHFDAARSSSARRAVQ
ncbi:MAG: hypothetical protein U0744_17950 [Gemmataceae bacterium]